jgi:hypothetical protein
MRETPTAPECIIIDCHRLAALTDVTRGRLWTFSAHYCADCYMALLDGTSLCIDPARVEVSFWTEAPEETADLLGGAPYTELESAR